MKIYTKTGDKGFTSLVTGTRVPKQHERIEAYGTVDELNAYIGLLRDTVVCPDHKSTLVKVQNDLFVIGSNLATDEKEVKFTLPELEEGDITLLEKEIDRMDKQLEPMRNFILPGGHVVVSHCHVARTICRRAERRTYQVAETNPVDEVILVYLNRLSDFLFTLARMLSVEFQAEEIPWKTK